MQKRARLFCTQAGRDNKHNEWRTAIARKPFEVKRVSDSEYGEAVRKVALAGFRDLQREHGPLASPTRVRRCDGHTDRMVLAA